MKNKYF